MKQNKKELEFILYSLRCLEDTFIRNKLLYKSQIYKTRIKEINILKAKINKKAKNGNYNTEVK